MLRAKILQLIPGLSTVTVTPHEDNYRAITRAFVSAVFLTVFIADEVKVKVQFTQEQATKTLRRSRGIAVLFLLTLRLLMSYIYIYIYIYICIWSTYS